MNENMCAGERNNSGILTNILIASRGISQDIAIKQSSNYSLDIAREFVLGLRTEYDVVAGTNADPR